MARKAKGLLALILALTLCLSLLPAAALAEGGEADDIVIVPATEAPPEEAELEALPPADRAEEVTASGTCGENLAWNLEDGVLTISGTGKMNSWNWDGAPWYEYRDSIVSVSLPDGLADIGEYAFSECSYLTSVRVPAGVKIIRKEAFWGCTRLESVSIPSSVAAIEDSAFYNCVALEDILLPVGVSSIGTEAFYNCCSLTDIVIPSGTTTIGDKAFQFCTSLRNVEIPASVTDIGAGVFSECSLLKNAGPTDGEYNIRFGWLYSIPTGAFYASDYLQTVTVPESVTSLGDYVFGFCSSLRSVILPDSVTAIGYSLFCNCTSLTSCKIPNGVSNIREKVFYDCSALTEVTIPEGMTSIGNEAFYNCAALSDVWYAGTAEQWNEITIGTKNTSLTEAIIHCHVHRWSDPSYSWADDNSSVTATRSCIDDENHIETETACTQYAVTVEPTTETCGVGIYTAIFVNEAFETQTKEVEIPKIEPIMIASGACGNYVSWSLNSSGVLTISGNGEMWNYEEGRTPWYENRESILSVIIDDGVTSIGRYSFYNCIVLKDITIPESVTGIGLFSYTHCDSLTDVYYAGTRKQWMWTNINSVLGLYLYLPNNAVVHYAIPVEVIATGNCSKYENGTVIWTLYSDGGMLIEGNGAHEENKMKGYDFGTAPWYEYRNSILYLNVFSVCNVGSGDFYNCGNLTDLSIDAWVTDIDAYAFYGCSSLKSFTVKPSSMSMFDEQSVHYSFESIGAGAFADCYSLSDVTIPCATSIYGRAFSNCRSLVEMTLPSELTRFGQEVFSGCESLVSLNGSGAHFSTEDNVLIFNETNLVCCLITKEGEYAIPNTVTNIDSYAFRDCSRLTNIIIPESVKGIGDDAFRGCSGLTDITIPDSVTFIGKRSFWECSSMVSIKLSESLTVISTEAFYECSSLEIVIIPGSVATIGDGAFCGCSSLTDVIIPEYVTSIGEYTFSGCSSLTDVTIPECVTSIGESAFYGCSSLTHMTIPNKLTSLGANAFYFCSSLENVIIPSGVGIIDNSTFYNCCGLKSVEISEGVTAISDYAFYGCAGLQSLTIPDGVTTLGIGAFACCRNLTYVTIPESATQISRLMSEPDMGLFTDCDKLLSAGPIGRNYNICYSWKDCIPMNAFNGCNTLTSVILPDSCRSVGMDSFRGCSSLKKITIPKSVTSIAEAFPYFKSLEITFQGPAPSFDIFCFYRSTVNAYYPADDVTWTQDKRQNYGGTTTWIPYTVPHINPFSDVPTNKYYYEPVLWAYNHDPQITGGVDDTHFGPNQTCTRAQIVTFLWKASGASEPVTTENPFTDVKAGKYYYKAVLWAVENGITSGVGDGKFGVNNPCTREQAMAFLWKACGSPEPANTNNPFTDVKSSKYYFKPIMWAVENGITSGVSADKFGVGQTCTRAQIVTFLYKAMD